MYKESSLLDPLINYEYMKCCEHGSRTIYLFAKFQLSTKIWPLQTTKAYSNFKVKKRKENFFLKYEAKIIKALIVLLLWANDKIFNFEGGTIA